jgi:hypothetical protein
VLNFFDIIALVLGGFLNFKGYWAEGEFDARVSKA